MTWRGRHIYLTGLPGAGKTSIGRALASELSKSGYSFIDLDSEIERRAGRTISEIFDSGGEEAFRAFETNVLAELADQNFHQKPYVIATGGGTPVSSLNRQIMRGSGVVVWIDVTVRQAAKNVVAGVLSGTMRPLLRSNSVEELTTKLRELYNARQKFYEQATLHFVARFQSEGERDAEDLAQELMKALEQMSRRVKLRPRFESLIARSAFGDYPVSVGSGITAVELARSAWDFAASRIVLVTDSNVAPLHLKKLTQSLAKETRDLLSIHQITVDAGETHKNETQLFELLREFSTLGVSRKDDLVVALGGGVVTDLVGFAASIYKRGIPLVHVPTSLIGQIDASIGGKTGIDFEGGKNMLGAFYPPRRVIVDPLYLQTLPKRELQSGLSELLKYALIGNEELWARLSKSIRRLLRGIDPGYEVLIRDAVKEKLRYTDSDEFERKSGVRELLNFGHTFAHAFESATGFTSLLHGEAVALGMRAAAWLSMEEGMLPEDDWQQIEVVLGRLPVPSVDCTVDEVYSHMRSDKKSSRGANRLILLERIGRAVAVNDVDTSAIKRAIAFALSVV
ncbi:MAG: 3-dehydroquinate synthase [Bacteroidetes bacterium]|nr:3-dehydroquinate synthase [Bacteroidota bacterium]